MKLTVISTHHSGGDMYYVGSEREVNEELGKELIAKGLAKEWSSKDAKDYPLVKSEAQIMADQIEAKRKGEKKEKGDGFAGQISTSEKKEKNANGTDKK